MDEMHPTEPTHLPARDEVSQKPEAALLVKQATMQELLVNLGPLMVQTGQVLDVVGLYAEQAFDAGKKVWEFLEPYDLKNLLPCFLGFVLMFFGGNFLTTVAAFEAFRLSGWSKIKENSLIFYEAYRAVRAKSSEDDLVDANHDGIPDVLQISKKELTTRKLKIILKVVDPAKVSEAIFFFHCSMLAVLATLRAQFAMAMTLGVSLGELLENTIEPVVAPALRHVMPNEYHKWIPVGLSYITKLAGVSVAWTIMRVVGAAHSAIRGGFIFIKGILYYLERHNIVGTVSSQASTLFVMWGMIFALSGFTWQLRSDFVLPFPLDVLLFPFTVIEWLLMLFVNFS